MTSKEYGENRVIKGPFLVLKYKIEYYMYFSIFKINESFAISSFLKFNLKNNFVFDF